ncbi:LytR/AlgR family response regulator transcription factor [Pseudoalteromonas sp. T1lg23B]|uniref:LytR/AlgR family response regulator transcription factor n=1 Tax=Pseudoalteromonas sp. T1lg23B TaxID=2077097 RepID=UPI000CF74208|nr:LytTR family DNA-binding domain-containing protein [Pseudoalteromonas sp. T1lg23B]
MDTLLKNQFYKLKDYQIMLIGWALILTVVCLNCTVHSVLIAKERVDIYSSIVWSLQKFGVWLVMTPALCNAFNHPRFTSQFNKYSVVGLYAIGFALAVNTTLDITIEKISWQESLFYQWHHHVIAYITIVLVWHLKHSFFEHKTEQLTETTTTTNTTESELEPNLLTIDDTHINSAAILFVKAAGNYIEVVTDKKTHLLRGTMKELESLLPDELFFRCHRSYFVNITHAKAVINERSGHGQILLTTEQLVPVSKGNRKHAHSLISHKSPALGTNGKVPTIDPKRPTIYPAGMETKYKTE